jgi:hypothetical protein
MVLLLTLVVMAAVAYAYAQQGATTAFLMCCNVFFAGLIAFNFWEPLAAELEPSLNGTPFAGFEDAIFLIGLFVPALLLLRWGTNRIVSVEPEQQRHAAVGLAVLFGLITGYLTAGFLVCVLQTLPWQRHFLQFDPKVEPGTPMHKVRRLLPPDRVWLALMHRAGRVPLARSGHPTFDERGEFEDNYARQRRYEE